MSLENTMDLDFNSLSEDGEIMRRNIADDLYETKKNMMVDGNDFDPDLKRDLQEYRSENGLNDYDDYTFLQKTFDVPAQAVNGFAAAADSMKDLIFDAGEAGAKLLYVDALGIATESEVKASVDKKRAAADVIPENPLGDPKSVVGEFAKPVSQFLAPFGVFSKMKYINGLSTVPKGFAAGAAADFVAFEEHEKRLSNLINEVGWGNSVTEYLAADENDSWAEGRFKNVLEGAGLGVLTESVFRGVKYMKQAKGVKKVAVEMRSASEARAQGIKSASAQVKDYQNIKPVKTASSGKKTGGVKPGAKASSFRPNKEEIDLATQRRLASAVGTTVDDVNSGKFFKDVRESGMMNKLNSVTMVQEQEFQKTFDSAQEYVKRIDSGDYAAADDFLRNEGAAYFELAGNSLDAMQDVGRVMNFRSKNASVVKTNELLKLVGEADNMSKASLVRLMAEAASPEKMDTLIKNLEAGRKRGHSLGKVMRESFYEIYNNMILSALKSIAVDTWSSVLMPASRVIEKLPQDLAGRARVAFGGDAQRIHVSEGGILLQSYIGSIFDGFSLMAEAVKKRDFSDLKAAVEVQKNRADFRSLPYQRTKWITAENYGVQSNTLFGKSIDVTGSFVRSVGDFYAAKDAVVGSMLARAERRAMAHARALNEGLSGSAYEDRVAALLSVADEAVPADAKTLGGNRVSNMVAALREGDDAPLIGSAIRDRAEMSARRGTFTDPASNVAQSFKSLTNELPGGRVVVPFIHTPDRIVARFMERSPFAPMFGKFWTEVRAGGRRTDEALGNFALGTSLMAGSWWLAMNGLVTGDGPKNSAERDAKLRTGWRPRSVKVGDKYYEIGRYAPFTMPMLFAANIVEQYDHKSDDMGQDLDQDVMDYLTMGAMGAANTLMSMTWMRGPAEIMDAIVRQDGRAMENILNFYASGMTVPNAVTFFANEVNPIIQQTDNMWEAIQAKAGVTVRHKYDAWGKIIKRDPQMIGYVIPSSYSNVSDDKTEQELLAAGFMPSRPDRKVDGVELSADEYAELMQIIGEIDTKGAMDNLVKSPVWKSLPDTDASGIEGAQTRTRSGLARYVYGERVKVAREILKSRNATLQQRILNFNKNMQTLPAATPGAQRTLQSQGVPVRQGPLRIELGTPRVNLGVGDGGNNK